MAKSDPAFVKLNTRLRSRGRIVADVAGGSRWKCSGYDVQAFPENRNAQRFVRREIRRGRLVEATEDEYDVIQKNRKEIEKVVKTYRGDEKEEEEKPRQTIQESNLRSASAEGHKKIQEEIDSKAVAKEMEEVDLDELNADQIAAGLDKGLLDPEEVREYEYERDRPRKTVLRALGEEVE